MSEYLSVKPGDFMQWAWEQIEPYYQELEKQPLEAGNLAEWLAHWSHLSELVYETFQRLYVGTTVNTTDEDTKKRFNTFLDTIFTRSEAAEQRLKEKLLQSGLELRDFEIPLRNLRAEAEIFRAENLPFLAEELKLSTRYDEIIGAQTALWEGEEVTLTQLLPVFQDTDRQRREQAWRLTAARWLEDRQVLNDLWVKLMDVRGKLARNAGFSNYRDYRWKQLLRFDYTPEDCEQFHRSIEQAVIPAARQLYERRREKLGLEKLRPWDLLVDPAGRPALKSFESIYELEQGVSNIFQRVDPQLGAYFEIMRSESLLDLDNRKDKAPGGYCTDFPVSGRPFIFMNAVGIHEDVQTLLHEGGHAFHVFETNALPYFQQKRVGAEIAEVASMGMELLAAPYLTRDEGGFYDAAQAARARIEHLEQALYFWPYMAVVDAFQHWVYENHQAASIPENCDAKWEELWGRFMIGDDWSGLEEEMKTGWQRKLHIPQSPFYYIEYGLAQLGAMQIWRNAHQDQRQAVADYRKALALGGTAPVSQLFATAGAKFAFDAVSLQAVVDLSIKTIQELETIV